ncbi:hypothetical protein PENSPDRAFT_684935 [Peniophora sp. CONT]|nr:hypothetical protein PENSPDRAFT_684935 [Peniophora sp. CONT]
MVRDALLLNLEALAQSADAFPPLKSAVGGLLFIARQLELVSSNKAAILEFYARIDSVAASLVRAVPDVTMLSSVARIAIHALMEDIHSLCAEVEVVASERPLLRFIRAQQTRGRLEGFTRRLDEAHASFIVSLM